MVPGVVGSSPITHPMKKLRCIASEFFQLNLPLRASEIPLTRSEIASQMWANLISLSAKAENFTMAEGHYFTFGTAEYFTKKTTRARKGYCLIMNRHTPALPVKFRFIELLPWRTQRLPLGEAVRNLRFLTDEGKSSRWFFRLFPYKEKNTACSFFMVLFRLFRGDICKNTAKEYPYCIRNHPTENHFHRCSVTRMLDPAEHIAVMVCHYDTHKMGENERYHNND